MGFGKSGGPSVFAARPDRVKAHFSDNCSKISGSVLPSASDLVRKVPLAPGTPAAQLGRPEQMSIITRFLRNEAGATAIEYGLIAAGIAVAIIATVTGLGTNLKATFTSVSGAL